MEISKIVGIGLVGGVISILIRRAKPELSMMMPIAVSVIVLLGVIPYLRGIVEELRDLSAAAGINSAYLMVIIKMIGVSYLASFSAELCKDAGENAIASKIELGGKLIILAMSIPIITRLLDLVREIIMHK